MRAKHLGLFWAAAAVIQRRDTGRTTRPGWERQSLRTAAANILGLMFRWSLLAWLVAGCASSAMAANAEPRIVNLYNFIRNSDFRVHDSEEIMLDCTRRQIALLKSVHLPATWALQYDALINPKYQQLLKEQLGTNDEIAGWFEIPQALAEAAGIAWRGGHEWDPAANVGFSPGYTPEERRKLADAYMAKFKAVFGYYPRTVGSWFIDEVTLEYLVKRYGLVASCNCKDQIGTDFYTVWGGYWNQAYYPSRLNAYMPAQTRAGQIDLPIFRMLGSDPIYQHGTTPGLQSLEPVYREAGGSPKWVAWFMNNLIHQPSLAFAYTQAGQENSFGWEAMKNGLTQQVHLFAEEAKAGLIRVETLEQSGRWFRAKFPLTPATAVVALDDWKDQGRKTVWYDSRFYRLNLLWDTGTFFIRDIHCFNEHVVSPTHETPLKQSSLTYETLPIVDWGFWSRSGRERAGLYPVALGPDGAAAPLQVAGLPMVKELDAKTLSIEQPLAGGGKFTLVCSEKRVMLAAKGVRGERLPWAAELAGGSRLKSLVKSVAPKQLVYHHSGLEYPLTLGAGACRQSEDGSIRLSPNEKGTLILELDDSRFTPGGKPPHAPN